MTINETEARIRAKVWQSIAQSELDVSCLETGVLDKLVKIVTETALLEVDDELGKSLTSQKLAPAVAPTGDAFDDDEPILWEGRPFLSLTVYYKITDERILITEGLLGRTTENIELIRIQDIAHSQSAGERLFNVGDVTVRSHDSNQPTFELKNVRNPQDVHEVLRRAVLNARKRHNFTYREEM